MNADDRAPAGESQQSFTPASGDAAVRRSGIMPASGSVPQRTAFRPVTGQQPVAASAAQTTARPASAPQPATGQAATRQAFAPASAPQPTTTSAPRSPIADRPASGPQPTGTQPTGTPATGAQETSDVKTRSVSASAGIGKLKGLKDKATDKVQASDGKPAAALGPRKVRVLLSRVDPWSALKIGFLLSIAAGIMFVVAMHILWTALNSMGTIALANEWVQRLFTTDQEVNILQFIDYPKVMSATLLVAVTNVVLISGLSVIGAFIYNTASRVVGGVYLTLTDD